MSSLRTGPRWARVLAAGTTAGLVLNGLRLRSRTTGLPTLDDPTTTPAVDVDRAGWRVVVARGVTVDDAIVERVAAWAEREGLDAVDLVPADLPVERLLDLVRQVDPATYRTDALAEGRTAGHAVVVREDTAKRADLPEHPVTPAEFVEVARQVKRFAPRTHDLVVVPGLTAVDLGPGATRAVLNATYDRYSSLAFTIPGLQLASLAAGAVLAPPLGLTALGAYLAQPHLVTAGTAAAPRDLRRSLLRRWDHRARRLAAAARATAPAPATRREADRIRPSYQADLAQGLDRFFEDRIDACPWCGSSDLSVRVVSPDLIQHKPGEFHLEQCGACDHIFQNPRLSLEGLDFYYRDFYDGFGAGEMERIFAAEADQYDGRVDMVADALDAPPERWLDVGTGHGHFCLIAQERWPETAFEGVDMGSEIEEAEDRGWVQVGHRGMFPELAPRLAGRYDVVSMHHYLEHTRDPKAELDASAVALKPGGHLLIEVPDPECAWGRYLGHRWLPWFQPQHQHFVSIDNLEAALRERGFTPLGRDRARSNQALDLVAGIWLGLGEVAPRPGMPWNGPATIGQRAKRAAVVTAALPAMIGVGLVDKVLDAVADPEGIGNTYRVLARYDGPT